MAKKPKAAARAKPESTQNQTVLVDTDFPRFLDDLERLADRELEAVQATVDKLGKMTWNDIYKTSSKTPGDKRGLNFEPLDQQTANGQRIASIRVTNKFRARVCRDGRHMRFISLHPDHDSAYDESGGEDLSPQGR